MRIARALLPYNLVEDTKGVATVTAYAGLPVVIEALRAFVPQRHYRPLARALGYSSRVVQRHMETLVALIAAGGENVSDVCILRADEGLSATLGFTPSCATTLKEFLYRFHQTAEGQPLTREQDEEASRVGQATIRPEGPAMRALAEFRRSLTRALTALRSPRSATLDVDATIIESHKKQALRTYEGSRGYQPQLAFWAEMGTWVCDEFHSLRWNCWSPTRNAGNTLRSSPIGMTGRESDCCSGIGKNRVR